MNRECQGYMDMIADLVSGVLSEEQSIELDKHLAGCAACRSYREALEGEDVLLGRLVDGIEGEMSEQEQRLISKLTSCESKEERRTSEWRRIMKNRTFKIAAAAAVIVIVTLVGVGPFLSGGVTFAKVVAPILNAKSLILDVVIGNDDSNPTMHEVVVGGRIRRTISNLPNLTQILDVDEGKMLVLDGDEKTAAYVDISGMVQEGTRNYVEALRQIIRGTSKENVEKIAGEVINGQDTVMFVSQGPNGQVKIWANSKTGHPMRVELAIGQGFGAIMKNFEFDKAADESLVSMEAPEGYTLKETAMDLSQATEADFAESLRIWAEMLLDGSFPDAIGSDNAMKQMPALAEKLKATEMSEEQGMGVAMSFARGMLFHQMVNQQGKWEYSGAGVKLGDADKVVFRYQPQGSTGWRVIYGDLRVRDE